MMMGKLFFSTLGAVLAGASLLAACVGEDAPGLGASAGRRQGELDSPCFANGTCNPGLSCSVIKGTAQCAAPAAVDAAVVGLPSEDASAPDAPRSGPPICMFQTTKFPCGGMMPPLACFGTIQGCTLTGCGGADQTWECFSPRQCSNKPCCVSTVNERLTAAASCGVGKLQVTSAIATNGSGCTSTTACPTGDAQLCQANSDCPAGQHCTPVKVTGGGVAIEGTVVAACVP